MKKLPSLPQLGRIGCTAAFPVWVTDLTDMTNRGVVDIVPVIENYIVPIAIVVILS